MLGGLSGCDAFSPAAPVGGSGGFASPVVGSGATLGVGGSAGRVLTIGAGGSSPGEDRDQDGLPTAVEIAVGLDPYRADTDGDGCSDYFDSAFPECDGNALTGYPSACDNFGRSVVIANFPPALKGRVVRFEVASFSVIEEGLGGAGGSGEFWEPTRVDGEPVVLVDERGRAVELPLRQPPPSDAVRNAADVEILRLLVRVLDHTSNEELYRWVAYRAVAEPCLVP